MTTSRSIPAPGWNGASTRIRRRRQAHCRYPFRGCRNHTEATLSDVRIPLLHSPADDRGHPSRAGEITVSTTTSTGTPSIFLTSGKLAHFEPGAGIEAGAASRDVDHTGWWDIAIPGDVHRTLIDAGEIPDPFWDQQERDVAWLAEKEWWYRSPRGGPDAVVGE